MTTLKSTRLPSFMLAAATLTISQVANAFPSYLSDAATQNATSISGCTSCHKSPSGGSRWTGIDAAFASGGVLAVSNCLSNNACGSNATAGSGSGTGSVSNNLVLLAKNVSASVGASDNGNAASVVYKVSCPKKTVKLAVSINDLEPINDALLTIQALKDFSAVITTDPVDADGNFSPIAYLERGAGAYTVIVSKQLSATLGAELFTAKIECIGKSRVVSKEQDD